MLSKIDLSISVIFSTFALTLFSSLPVFADGSASAAPAPQAPYTPPQAAPDCLDLGAYLSQIRAMPDTLFIHHPLVDLALKAPSTGGGASDMANQTALDVFYHPEWMSLGLAAGKSGGQYMHDFNVYQLDCTKLVSGDVFAVEGKSVIWEIVKHTSNTLTVKPVTSATSAIASDKQTLVFRTFQVVSPTVFLINTLSVYETAHTCPDAAPVTEKNILSTTEAFVIDNSPLDPKDASSPALKMLMAKYPRAQATGAFRGEFATPVTPQNDGACGGAADADAGAGKN